MNNHLLPFPYNQSSQPPTWLERVLIQPLSDALLLFFGGPKHAAVPISIPNAVTGDPTSIPPIRVICISDTHNANPPLPTGDILIHAGDLTDHGTFNEVQAQLRWLAGQPHTHKIVIAGNHDLLLDEAKDSSISARGGADSAAERKELDWSGIRYLQDEVVTVEVQTRKQLVSDLEEEVLVARKVKIYGSPLTPEFGQWAFQYPAIRDVWTGRVPDETDILVVHGPPALYGDWDGEKGSSGNVKVKGDGYLLREIRRVQPKMVVCGHIHGAFGVTVIQHDGIQDAMNGLRMRWGGYALAGALKQALWSKVTMRRNIGHAKETLVVNAAIAHSESGGKEKSAMAIDLH